jgi:hypothetical protein
MELASRYREHLLVAGTINPAQAVVGLAYANAPQNLQKDWRH